VRFRISGDVRSCFAPAQCPAVTDGLTADRRSPRTSVEKPPLVDSISVPRRAPHGYAEFAESVHAIAREADRRSNPDRSNGRCANLRLSQRRGSPQVCVPLLAPTPCIEALRRVARPRFVPSVSAPSKLLTATNLSQFRAGWNHASAPMAKLLILGCFLPPEQEVAGSNPAGRTIGIIHIPERLGGLPGLSAESSIPSPGPRDSRGGNFPLSAGIIPCYHQLSC
jgi:hypothetical protein